MKEILFLIQIRRTCKVRELSLSCLFQLEIALTWGEASILIESTVGCLVGQIASILQRSKSQKPWIREPMLLLVLFYLLLQ